MNWPALANRRFGLSSAARRRYNRAIEALLAESEEAMRSKVTEAGVILPRQWFPGVEEVEIRRENDRVVVQPFRPDDPIGELGRHPITTEVDDASLNHDRYLYGR